MSRRKKHQEESYENAEGFQIEDMQGNAVEADEDLDEDSDSFWDDDEDEQDEDEHFNSIAENEDWEEGYDY